MPERRPHLLFKKPVHKMSKSELEKYHFGLEKKAQEHENSWRKTSKELKPLTENQLTELFSWCLHLREYGKQKYKENKTEFEAREKKYKDLGTKYATEILTENALSVALKEFPTLGKKELLTALLRTENDKTKQEQVKIVIKKFGGKEKAKKALKLFSQEAQKQTTLANKLIQKYTNLKISTNEKPNSNFGREIGHFIGNASLSARAMLLEMNIDEMPD